MVENRWVGAQTRDRKLLNVALKRAAVGQIAGDVVEPQILSKIVQSLRRLPGRVLTLCMDENRSPAGQQIPDAVNFDVGWEIRTQDCRITCYKTMTATRTPVPV